MRIQHRLALGLTLLVAAVGPLTGCGSGTFDNFVSANANPTALTISPKPVAKELGETQQFVATATFDNGTTADVTSLVQWSSSNPAVVSINASTGLATAVMPGQVTVKAESSGFSDTVTMTASRFISRVSVDSAGAQTMGFNNHPSVSGDGRFVVFTRFVNVGGVMGSPDVLVRDRQAGTTTSVIVDPTGGPANGNTNALGGSISQNGRFVLFGSYASNLVAGDTNGQPDVFVRDLQANVTTRVSLNSTGGQRSVGTVPCNIGGQISGDGRFILFFTLDAADIDGNGQSGVFVKDLQTGTNTRLSGEIGVPVISANGRFVAFQSSTSNLVAGDTNGVSDVFVRDIQTGTTTRVSLDSSGIEGNSGSGGPTISADGRFVAFSSAASNLVAGDTNGVEDAFVRDLQTGTTTRVSLDSAGQQGNGSSTGDSQAISPDGRFVVFVSGATNLVEGDTNGVDDVFVRDVQAGTTKRLSLDSAGIQGNLGSFWGSISGDGRFVAFASLATNLVAGDTNGESDIFITKP